MVHPDQLLELLTAEQFRDWCAYYMEEPWGFEVVDLQQARLMALVAAAAGAREASIESFLLRRPEEARSEMEATPEATAAALSALFGLAP